MSGLAVCRRTLTPTPLPGGEGLRFSLALGLSDPIPTCPLFRIPNLESPIPNLKSRFPIPDSRFPIPDSPFPALKSPAT
ncbi:hypothetical protein XAP7430_550015 [Xanthomonas phaseoli pv. phaseoli]|uniref:Secreted protein n=1 Tax=Xanthomonas campestris pv. phaseoli TaxID=317013 RepID=A0AB38E481_XANCH|nr:hypothetical protein XAP7430_550015 [Xanthomonas phaseoli pv. phaseoli]